jgi:hypothetical protein
MPNPLLTPEEKNVSKGPSNSLSDHEPVEESYAGENFPYRGIETHGVQPTDDPTNMPDWREDGRIVPIAYVPAGVEVDPVPVRIVNTGSAEVDKWRVSTFYAGVTPVRLIGRDDKRTVLKIKNLTESETVYVSPDSTVSTFSGYPIATGESIELRSTDEVWAVASADGVVLSALWEYTIEVP